MRISFVIPYFYPALEYGGTPRVAYEFARSLVRRGHEVRVLTTDSGGHKRIERDEVAQIEEGGIDGIQLIYYQNVSNYLAYKQRLFFPLELFHRIRRQLSSSEVVHIHEFRSLLSVATHSAVRSLNIPYVISPHGGLQRLGKVWLKSVFDRLWGNKILKDAAAVCAVSPLEEQDAAQFGIEYERIYPFPNPIDADHYTQLPDRGRFTEKWNLRNKRVVLFLGRLHWIKGIDVLIDSMVLIKDIPDLHLVIAGPDDGAASALRSRVMKNGMGDRITFTGFLNDLQKLEALVDSEVVVVPSRREGFPGTALEALAAARPVVLSSMCGLVSWIPGRSAMTIFRSGDAKDLAQKMGAVLRSGCNPTDLSNARNLVLAEFSADAMAAKAEALYQSVISPKERVH